MSRGDVVSHARIVSRGARGDNLCHLVYIVHIVAVCTWCTWSTTKKCINRVLTVVIRLGKANFVKRGVQKNVVKCLNCGN